ncbi:hypothetical protein BGX29_011369 [Mortierella sp. GBA35]|nr:hypothetical protein BGX29_011369 [Mortierella sp. GBA35]
MKERINESASTASDEILEGTLSIVYERIQDLRWLPGTGNDDTLKDLKHWKLVIRLGIDCFTLEFLENSIVSTEGLVTVGDYRPGCYDSNEYPLADLRMSTATLFKWITYQFKIWSFYNVATRNCHHFVQEFLRFAVAEDFVFNVTPMMREISDGYLDMTAPRTKFLAWCDFFKSPLKSTSSRATSSASASSASASPSSTSIPSSKQT